MMGSARESEQVDGSVFFGQNCDLRTTQKYLRRGRLDRATDLFLVSF